MASPVAYDEETEELLAYYHSEITRREREPFQGLPRSTKSAKAKKEAEGEDEAPPKRRGRPPKTTPTPAVIVSRSSMNSGNSRRRGRPPTTAR